MIKWIAAEYDATERVLRLEERPEDLADREKLTLVVVRKDDSAPSIIAFRGCMSDENGADFAARIEEMFPIEK